MFGVRVAIDEYVFVVGQPALRRIGDGFVLVTGEIEARNGKRFWVIHEICEEDSGEYYGSYFPYQGRLISGSGDRLAKSLGMRKEDLFPYRYRYDIPLRQIDIHIGYDGWNR